eukprot:2744534-Lingulodinium_polyedra.AAC.1
MSTKRGGAPRGSLFKTCAKACKQASVQLVLINSTTFQGLQRWMEHWLQGHDRPEILVGVETHLRTGQFQDATAWAKRR